MNGIRETRRQWRQVGALAVCLLLGAWGDAYGLDPGRAITQYIQTTWSSEAGLPQNSVHAITQTRDGFVWLGTEEGFARFDGVQFKVYNTRNTRGLASDFIEALAAGADGSLWVGTDSGLSHFVPATAGHTTLAQARLSETLTARDGLAGDSITALCEDPSGTLWVGTATGLSRLRGGRAEGTQKWLTGMAVEAIAADGAGRVWVGTDGGLFELEDGRLIDHRSAIQRHVTALAVDRDGSVWAGTLERGLLHFGEGRLLASPRLPWKEIAALRVDRDGGVWISFQRRGIGRLFQGRLSVYGPKEGLPSSRVTHALYEDREGGVWVGLLDAGMVQLRDGRFAVYGTREGLANTYTGNVLQARDGTMWIGTDINGLNHLFPDGRVEFWNVSRGLPNQAVFSLLETRDGDLWVGFRGGELARMHRGVVQVFRDPQAQNSSLNALLEDRAGNVWVGFFGKGVARFKNGRFEHLTTEGRVPALAETPDGALWIGMDGDGVARYWKGEWQRFTTAEGLPSNHVMSIYADGGGDVWVSTASGGLSRIRAGKVVSWTPDQGLPEATVGSIVEDDYGRLWIGGDGGIYSVAKQALNESVGDAAQRGGAVLGGRIETSRLYGVGDGLRSRETVYGSMPAAWKDRGGRIWFGTIAGAAVVDPGHEKRDRVAPPVWIESMLFDSRPAPLESDSRLGPGANNLEIAFTAPSFVAGELVRFRYRLEGLDRDWVDAGTRRNAWYTNLRPKHYVFTVQAENRDGVWNHVGDSIGFTILPPATETPVAYAGYGMGLVLAVWGVLVLRTRALVRRRDELTRIVAERTAQLEEEKRALESARQELQTRATHDSLTGLFNRGAILEHLQREVHRAEREKSPLGVLIVDLDHFKQVNDVFGHLCGDDVIRETGNRLRTAMRKYDLVGRYGGEEFLVLFPGWCAEAAPGRIDDLLNAIRSRPFEAGEHLLPMTCSIGVCTYRPGEESDELRDLLSRADAALYAAKNAGRNRACVNASCESEENAAALRSNWREKT